MAKSAQVQLKMPERGYFEGEGSVTLDREVDEKNHTVHEELNRLVYLESWRGYFPASFIDAPSVCYMCRLSGHIKKDCPELAKVQCYKCNEFGHMKFECDRARQRKPVIRTEPTESELIDQYIQDSQKKQNPENRIRKAKQAAKKKIKQKIRLSQHLLNRKALLNIKVVTQSTS
ncbi:hypothetical protein Unana1_02850 [Umbelopsis nana]